MGVGVWVVLGLGVFMLGLGVVNVISWYGKAMSGRAIVLIPQLPLISVTGVSRHIYTCESPVTPICTRAM